MPSQHVVYGLVDPRCPDVIRYVGKTSHMAQRKYRYRKDAENPAKRAPVLNWWRVLPEPPIFVILAAVETLADLDECERWWIRRLQRLTFTLVCHRRNIE